MTSIDWRTRGPEVRKVDPVAFFEEELPAQLQETGELAGRGAIQLGLESLAIEVNGRCWTLHVEQGVLGVVAGDAQAALKTVMGGDAFSDLVDDYKSTLGIAIAARTKMLQGSVDRFVAWEPVLRAALDGRAVYEPGSVTLRDSDGAPVDLQRSFDADDSQAEMRHFLVEAGYLRLEAVFTEQEMNAVAADLDRALDAARPDDETSWWVKTEAGVHRPSRILDFIHKSEALRALLADERFVRLAQIPGHGHLHLDTFGEHLSEPAAEGLVKPLGVKEGISDLPWHKDCARGGHSRFCCGLTVGISVTGADRESGELCVVAGSHRANLRGSLLENDLDLPRVALTTRKGDITLHCSCTLHMARAPSARERMVVYTGFGLPPRPGDPVDARDSEALKSERADISRQTREARLGGSRGG